MVSSLEGKQPLTAFATVTDRTASAAAEAPAADKEEDDAFPGFAVPVAKLEKESANVAKLV